jgi:hypothetical protein
MCKAFSAIVLKNGEVKWKFGMDSHSDILQHFGISDNEYEKDCLEFARIEISPANGSYLKPDRWEFKLDESITPTWWKKSYLIFAETEHKKWLKQLNKVLINKEIVMPFNIEPPQKILKKHLKLLRVWASVGASVRDSVWDSVRASVRDSVWDSVRASVGDSVRASVWDSVRDSVRASVYGQHDAGWLSFYNYFRSVCGLVDQTNPLMGLISVAQTSGWFLPHAKICWVSERHNILRRDDRGRLHDTTGPAVAYPDGWAIYAVHGVRVPSWIIERPQDIDPSKIKAEKNTEIRRVMLSKFGEAKYLEQSGAVEVSCDDRGTLYYKEIPGDEPLVMVRVENATPEINGKPKTYWLRVPPGCKTSTEAVAWTFEVEPGEYKPTVET